MLKRTALFEEHKKAGGRLIDFGGWELPVQYSGVMDEHLACRAACGIFDVSHMGEIHVDGPEAERFLNHLVTNDVSRLADGQALYSAMCHEDGGVVDDLVIYRRGRESFLVVVNASNTEKDYAHVRKHAARFPGARVSDESARYSQIALQGRNAAAILGKLTSVDLAPIRTYWFAEGTVAREIPAIIARSGYTGEDGFEIYVPWDAGPALWRALMEAGQPLGLKPCGLGARDTLRLEMKYALYGNELTDATNPLEAGLGWVVKLDKPEFVGRDALLRVKLTGPRRKLVGLRLKERGIPRHGYAVHDAQGAARVGELTSGTQSPSLKQAIGIAYVDAAHAATGTALTVDIRGAKIPAEVVPTPFYKRPY
jgi:aminomethyltransferase